MPKKTRKEKLRADRLRSTHSFLPSVPAQTNNASEHGISSLSPFSFHLNTHPESAFHEKVSSVDLVEFTAIKQDIVKTVLLAAVAISVEILLYKTIGK